MKVHASARSLIIVAASLILPAAATAQGAAADSASKLKAVKVTEARSTGVVGGASAVVIKTREVKASPAPLLDQALRETPFLLVRQNSRGETELAVRGSDSRQASVMLDGVPITIGWDHRTDVSLVPVTGSEEITVVRGLGSILGGPNTLGGTIAIASRTTGLAAGTGRWWGGLGIDDNASYVASVGGERNLAAGSGILSLRGGAAQRKRDGFALPGGATDPTAEDGLRTNSDLDEADAFASLRWSNSAGRSIGVTLTGFNAEKGVPPEEHLASPRFWRYPYHTRAVVGVSGGTGAFATPWGTATLEAGAGLNTGRYHIDQYSNRTYTTVTAVERGNEQTMSGRLAASHTLGERAKLGLSATSADVKFIESLPPVADAHYRQKLLSLAGEVEASIGDRTTVSAGIALDKSETPETGGRSPEFSAFDKLGWRAGLERRVNERWRLNASASQRSRFPALRELYSGALNRFRPNPNLRPETLLGFEGGFTWSGAMGDARDATFQVTAFKHTLDDAVIRIQLSNPTRFERVNKDRIESSGAELLAGFSFGADRARAVTLSGDATIQRITLYDKTAADAERHAETNPEMRANLNVGVPLLMNWRGNAGARHTGTQYCLAGTTGEIKLDAQTVSDLSVERTFSFAGMFRSVRALIALDNVGNATVFDICGLPQPGRTLRAMFSFR
jgi:iron complex outermembrane receptor protein